MKSVRLVAPRSGGSTFFAYMTWVLDMALVGGIVYYLYHHYAALHAVKALAALHVCLPIIVIWGLMSFVRTIGNHINDDQGILFMGSVFVIASTLNTILVFILPYQLLNIRLSSIHGFFQRVYHDFWARLHMGSMVATAVFFGLMIATVALGSSSHAAQFLCGLAIVGFSLSKLTTIVAELVFLIKEMCQAFSWHALWILLIGFIISVGIFSLPRNLVMVIKNVNDASCYRESCSAGSVLHSSSEFGSAASNSMSTYTY